MKNILVATALVLTLGFGTVVEAQVCTVNFQLWNRDREVNGEVNVECAPDIHPATWGNWGVNSNWGTREDGHQFQGWCHDDDMPDGSQACTGDWYEWNSCTQDHIRNDGVSCYYYNVDEDGISGCEAQRTQSSFTDNLYGSGSFVQSVGCPLDTNGDGVFDTGGCLGVGTLRINGNYMDLYELDKRDFDTFVNRLSFPNLSVSPQNCEWDSCPSTPVQSWHAQTGASPALPGTEAKIGLAIANAHYSFDCRTCEALPNDPCCAACGNN